MAYDDGLWIDRGEPVDGCEPGVCTGNPVRVDDVTESPKLAE